MISTNMIRTLPLIVIALSLISTASSASVTSPRFCLSNLECPPTSFCNDTDRSQLPRCTRLLPENAACDDIGLGECKKGFTCNHDASINTYNPVCRLRAPRGAECRPDDTRPCAGSLICDRNTTTCQPFTGGFAGSPCETSDDCRLDKGFYCNSNIRMCSPRRGPGSDCGFRSDSFECVGFCVFRRFSGICLAPRKEGDLCTDTRQCEKRFFDPRDPRTDTLICNIPKGVVGRCIRESRLQKRLGAKCDPDHDRCDERRSLSCHPTRGGRHVCQHLDSRFGDQFPGFCEPHNRLSRCPLGDERTECRLERFEPGRFIPSRPSPFFMCKRRSERVTRGGICVAEYAACAGRTECREVPGVQPESGQPFPPPRVAFCVRIVRQGRSCGNMKNKFSTQCEEGLRCEKGTCVKAEKNEAPFDEAVTHAGLRAFCEDLPCAPGLVCEKGEFDSKKRCQLPLRIVGKGKVCTDRAVERRRCKNGFVCTLRKDGTNVRRCREPRKAGDYCRENEECDKDLICPSVWTPNREQEERRCYDPRTTLSLGQTCDPKASNSQPRCVVNERTDLTSPGEFLLEPMRCVEKGDEFACRVIVKLFDFCDEERDFTCDSGAKCGNFGICVPAGDT